MNLGNVGGDRKSLHTGKCIFTIICTFFFVLMHMIDISKKSIICYNKCEEGE